MSVLFFLQLKRALKAVPRVIAGATIPLLLVGMAVFLHGAITPLPRKHSCLRWLWSIRMQAILLT